MASSLTINGTPYQTRAAAPDDAPNDLGSTYTRRRFNPSTGDTRAEENAALREQERQALSEHARQQKQQRETEEQQAFEDEARNRLLRRTGREPDEAAVDAEAKAMREEGVTTGDDNPKAKLGDSVGSRYLPDHLR